MIITAIALDDEQPALEILETFCSQVTNIDLKKTFLKTSEANYYLETNPVDLIFLDINMPSRSGIDFFKAIPQDMMVVFTTAYKEYAVESYEVGAIDYLLKPFDFDRFKTTVDRIIEKKKLLFENNEDSLYFKIDYGLVKVPLRSIILIEGQDNYIKIHLENQKPILVRNTIKNILEKLPEKHFCRIHRSSIIALSKISSYRNKTVYTNDLQVAVGNTFEKEFLEKLENPFQKK